MSDNTKSKAHDPPQFSSTDAAHIAAKAAISAIPIVGGPAAELFAAIVTPPLERRRHSWMEEVAETLRELEKQGLVSFDALQQDDAFIDSLLHASVTAMRTHQQEKRAALRNAVLNSSLPDSPDESVQLVMLSLIDQFTVWHLRILKLYQDPAGWAMENNRRFGSFYSGGLSTILESAYPELRDKRGFYDQVWRELYLRGLTSTESLHTVMTESGLMTKRTTDLGDTFLRFIEKPEGIGDDGT